LLPQVNWTKGSVLFASGSPFPAMCYDGCEPLQPAQANNAYIFPAVGHAAVLTKAMAIPNEVSSHSLLHSQCADVQFHVGV
jgi:malate dehydrogenase (oxaloacetate-decarboxylating)(NADP+)